MRLPTGRLRFRKRHGLAIACALALPSAAQAATLWYNGDYDLDDAASNQNNVPINIGGSYVLNEALAYDDFVVPVGQIWTITGLFSDDQVSYPNAAPTSAIWEIRSGMSAGNGGTLVANGNTTATATLLTAADGNNYIDPEYRISAALTGVTLAAGTYWMAVAPDSAGYYGDQSYIETTSGANAIGTPPGNNGNSFLKNNNPVNASTFAPSSEDFSAGVIGTATTVAVPEPTGAPALFAGLVAAPLLARRRGRSPVVAIV